MASSTVTDSSVDDEFDVETNTVNDIETVTQRLKEFTYYLVENIEFNLNFCLQLLEERALPPKPTSLHVTALSLLFSAVPKIGAGIGSALKTGESTIFRRIEKKNSRILAELVYYFSDNKETFRNTVIDAAVEVFSSFENQFMRLSCNGGEKRAMQKLAIDASDRIFNHFLITEQNKDVTKTELIKGIIYGDSKRNKLGKKEGKTVSKDKITWKTCKLYHKVGIVIVEKNEFYKSNTTKPNKYGYRKIFSWEDEHEITTNWILDNVSEVPTYTLILTKDLAKTIKEYIMTKTPFEEAKLERLKYSTEAMNDRQEKYNETLKVLKQCYNNILNKMSQLISKLTVSSEDNKSLLEHVAKNQEEESKNQLEIITKLERVHENVLETKENQEYLTENSKNIRHDIIEIKSSQNEMALALVKPDDLEELIKNKSKESAKQGIKDVVSEALQNVNVAPIFRNGIEIAVPKIKEEVERAIPNIEQVNNNIVNEIKEQIITATPKVQEEVQRTLQKGHEEVKRVEENIKSFFKF